MVTASISGRTTHDRHPIAFRYHPHVQSRTHRRIHGTVQPPVRRQTHRQRRSGHTPRPPTHQNHPPPPLRASSLTLQHKKIGGVTRRRRSLLPRCLCSRRRCAEHRYGDSMTAKCNPGVTPAQKSDSENSSRPLKSLVAREGFEPPTKGL